METDWQIYHEKEDERRFMEGLDRDLIISGTLDRIEKNHLAHIQDNMNTLEKTVGLMANDSKWIKRIASAIFAVLLVVLAAYLAKL